MGRPDYIVVGAGSAGCVLANRLSASGQYRVHLLEAGGSDWRFWVKVPIGYGKIYYQHAINWMYNTQPQAGLDNRVSYWPRGKLLGGSSSINAMVHIRGHRKDYDDWATAGNPGWSYDEVLPYFKRSETNQAGADDYRGIDGPLYVADVSKQLHPLCQNFIQAGIQAGLQHNPDFNGANQQGIGVYQITTKSGVRMSAASAYLQPAKQRSNLLITTHAHVLKVLFKNKRAIGVEFKHKGKHKRVYANKEVILSAGAINTPQLLMLSGIGHREELESLGVKPVHHSPAVGKNLQDHLGMDYLFKSKQATLNTQLHPWHGKVWAGIKYLLFRKGPLSLSLNQAGGFIKSDSSLEQPDIQLYFSPVSYTRAPAQTRPLMNPDPFAAFMIGIGNTRPSSRGQIKLKSKDPFEYPNINPNYLSAAQDIQTLLLGVKFIRKLAEQAALKNIILEEFRPGQLYQTDQQLIADIRQHAWTIFHPACSCRMGADPTNNVVDHQLYVYGMQNLRLCDASIFPCLISGNTNASVIMVAEKAADLILNAAQN